MSTDRDKALDMALSQIDKQFGKGSIMRMGEKGSMAIEAISTGALALDLALGIGGLPRGRVTEIYGPESSGKSTLAMHVVAEAQRNGGTCAYIDADRPRVHRTHGVFGIDVGADAPVALRLGDHVHGERRLARRLRAEDLGDAASRQSADAEGEVERQRPGGDRLDAHRRLLAHAHDRALAVLLVDLGQGHVERLVTVCAHVVCLSERGTVVDPWW